MSVTFEIGDFTALTKSKEWPFVLQVLIDHWKETGTFQHLMKFNPDWNRYLQLDREKRLHLIVVRDFGNFAGYSLYVIAKGLLHYRHVTVADDDVTFLMPHLRKTGAHQKLRAFAMKTLKAKGVQIITARIRVGHEHDKGLKAAGFIPWDMVYAYDLTEEQPTGA